MQSLTQRLLQGQNLRTNAWLKKDSNERINKRTKHLTTERTNERNNELTNCDTRILPTDKQQCVKTWVPVTSPFDFPLSRAPAKHD